MRRPLLNDQLTAGAARVMRALGAVVLTVVLAACSLFTELLPSAPQAPPRECTLIGCSSGVLFHVPVDLAVDVAYDVEACIDEACERQVLRVPLPDDGPFTGAGQGSISLSIDSDTVSFTLGERELPGRHRVRLTVRQGDALLVDDERDVEFVRTQPNGPGCLPVCWGAQVVP